VAQYWSLYLGCDAPLDGIYAEGEEERGGGGVPRITEANWFPPARDFH
jgi:hypothetical protein